MTENPNAGPGEQPGSTQPQSQGAAVPPAAESSVPDMPAPQRTPWGAPVPSASDEGAAGKDEPAPEQPIEDLPNSDQPTTVMPVPPPGAPQPGGPQPGGPLPAGPPLAGPGYPPPPGTPTAVLPTPQAMPTEQFPPMPPGPFGPASQQQQPPYGPPPKPRSGRAGLMAGAAALALVAGGIGGGVGAWVVDHHDTSTALDSSDTHAATEAPAGSIQAVAQKVLPSVVMIKVTGNQKEGEGSGEILTQDGLILTNSHVATGGGRDAKMTVVFADGSTAPARLIGADSTYDLAVLKVNDKKNLTPIQLGSSRNLQIGQGVVAVGSPLGLAGTVTSGIVSSLNRPVATNSESPDGQQARGTSVIDAIQTDAAINPGNSGGALVDMSGKLVGINTAIASLGSAGPDQQSGSIGLGFAIPIDQAKRVADQLIKTGHAPHPVIGIMVRGAGENGAQVDDVTPDSPAAKVGIPKGATVTRIDNRLIDSNDALVAAVRSFSPGETVKVTYTDPTTGEVKTVQVTLASSDGGR